MAQKIKVLQTKKKHLIFSQEISGMINKASIIKGTGLARRTTEYLNEKIINSKAVIAIDGKKLVGFCYIESWGHREFVANSGLIVDPEYRNKGLASKIKKLAFEISAKKYPGAKIFGLTTSLAVMSINSELGYKPVTFSLLTKDCQFWEACKTCPNHDILQRTKGSNCLCTAMVYDPKKINGYKNITITEKESD